MKELPRALVIDDEPSISGFVSEVLRSDDWDVAEAGSAEEAYDVMKASAFDLVFCDVILGGSDGYEVLRRFAAEQPGASFVLMTGHGSAAGALDATAIGAFDYLIKPFSVADILRLAGVVRERLRLRMARPDDSGEHPTPGYSSDIPLIGKSRKFVECLKMVGRVASTSLPVLITGESGTGKEIVANAIHRRSDRAKMPFVTVNCGAIPIELIESELFGHVRGSFTGASGDRMGMWEEAEGGTILLDEITETPPQFQVKLLRALQENEIRRVGSNKTIRVDVRVLCASNRDIETEVAEGRFRQDLMYRINAVNISLPPLRERLEDIPLLAAYFAGRVSMGEVNIAKESMKILESYSWPGNVRELENAMLHAVSMADDTIYPEHLPTRLTAAVGNYAGVPEAALDVQDLQMADGRQNYPTLSEMEAKYVARVLDHTGGNKQAAARILNIDRKTLTRILARNNSSE